VKLQRDLREFIESLNSHAVEYLVVGAHAVAFHGHPRFTGDLDFWVRPTRENGARVLDALHAFGFSDLGLSIEELARPDVVVQLGRAPNRIDLLTAITGVGFDEAWRAKVSGELDGLPVSFLGLEALLRNKEATGRDQDLADARKLRAIAARRDEPV
jgi:Nucleotidyl transferase of unknown function (DUF2204)